MLVLKDRLKNKNNKHQKKFSDDQVHNSKINMHLIWPHFNRINNYGLNNLKNKHSDISKLEKGRTRPHISIRPSAKLTSMPANAQRICIQKHTKREKVELFTNLTSQRSYLYPTSDQKRTYSNFVLMDSNKIRNFNPK